MENEVLVKGIILDKKDFSGNPLVRVCNSEIYVERAFIVAEHAELSEQQVRGIVEATRELIVSRLRAGRYHAAPPFIEGLSLEEVVANALLRTSQAK